MSSEMLFFWVAVICYGLSAFTYVFGLLSRKEVFFTAGMALAIPGCISNGVAVALRWIESGALPFIEIAESITTGVFIAVILFLAVQIFSRKLKPLGVLVIPVCFVLLGWAGTLMKNSGGEMAPALQSKWLWVHILAASIGFSCVLVAAGLSLLFLLKEKKADAMYNRLPALPELGDLAYRFVTGGFILLGLMIISGALWSNQVKGNYWNWDPVEVWSLICWLVYGIYLHLRVTFGWRGARLAWYAMLALIVMIIGYWGIPFVVQNFHTGFRIEH